MSSSDSDNDLFGEETEEERIARESRLKEEREKAEARAAEKEKKSRSSIIVEVSPEDIDVDLDKVAEVVRAKKIDGLEWGQKTEKVPIGFGLSNLRLIFTIVDAKVDSSMIDDIFEAEDLQGLVSSHRIASWNKL
eukprot:CAMPEP_0117439628 /NCGR_PEP_ID=MMETSP0759-20121206/2662_1 /TAXON_ID=63605 /ORGANISM="Percolomonas cosmopolitus, Strain WS" /LENGTH=134 /DNA_ID=CAMNT_0005231347 /DNA_START=28 /DNA_END=432 /DNA_ORIENTATION=-